VSDDAPLPSLCHRGEPRLANLRPFRPGQSGNPRGMAPGTRCGRARALQVLDEILIEPATQSVLRTALRDYIQKHPVAAFKSLVMPLLPREIRADFDPSDGRISIHWKSLCRTAEIPETNDA
jgi:hypothetical protein